MNFNKSDNSTKIACFYQGSVIVSKIGEYILRDKSRENFAYAFFHMLKNFTEEPIGEDARSFVYGFLPHLLLMLVLIVALSHALHFFLSRLKQPLFISQIIVRNLTPFKF
jgi:hypothetical protein